MISFSDIKNLFDFEEPKGMFGFNEEVDYTKANLKKCSGLIITNSTVYGDEDPDPANLEISVDWDAFDENNAAHPNNHLRNQTTYKETEETVRLWYDWSSYGQYFCIQAVKSVYKVDV